MDDREARALLERLGRLETGQLSDVLDEAGLPHHALDGSLRPL
jgi:4-hydroxy-4-methyl-2-oxoglutarate aldolase